MRRDLRGSRWRSIRLLDAEGLWAGPWILHSAAPDIPILFAHHEVDGTVIPMTAIALLLPMQKEESDD